MNFRKTVDITGKTILISILLYVSWLAYNNLFRIPNYQEKYIEDVKKKYQAKLETTRSNKIIDNNDKIQHVVVEKNVTPVNITEVEKEDFNKKSNAVILPKSSNKIASMNSGIDLNKWKELPLVTHTCPENSIIYEQIPASGIRTILCHAYSIWPIATLEKLSGEKVFLSGPHTHQIIDLHSENAFGHYNPAFIDWFIENMIPDYNDITTQLILKGMYEGYLKPIFRASIETFYDLATDDSYRNEEILKYKNNPSQQKYYQYIDRWKNKRSDNYANGAQVYSFWLRRYVDETSIIISSELERFLSIFDLEYLNQIRSRYYLKKINIEPIELAQNSVSVDHVFKTSEGISDIDKKIQYLGSIRFEYIKPTDVSRILMKIGDLKSRHIISYNVKDYNQIKQKLNINGYHYNEINGNFIYNGQDYNEIIRLYPYSIYEEEAIYKKLRLHIGGECEGEDSCEIDSLFSRKIDFISKYPGSIYVDEILKEFEKSFDHYINRITITSDEYDPHQIDLKKSLDATLSSLRRATESSSDEIKLFSNYYSGLFYLKQHDLVKSKHFFEKNLDLVDFYSNQHFILSKSHLDNFPSEKVMLYPPKIILNRFHELKWKFNGISKNTEIGVYRKVENKNFNLIKKVKGTSTQLALNNIDKEVFYKVKIIESNTNTRKWSNIVKIFYEPVISVEEAYIRDNHMYLWISETRGWTEIMKIDLLSQDTSFDSVGFFGSNSCKKSMLNQYNSIAVIDKGNRDYALLSDISDYKVRIYHSPTFIKYKIRDLTSCLKDESDTYRLAGVIDRPNRTIWLHPFDNYVRRPEIDKAWISYNNNVFTHYIYDNVKVRIRNNTYDQVSLLNTPDYTIYFSGKNNTISLINSAGNTKTLNIKVANNAHGKSPFQYSKNTNSIIWLDTYKSISTMNLTTKKITRIVLSRPVAKHMGFLQALYNHKTKNYWILADKRQSRIINNKKTSFSRLSLYVFDQNGGFINDSIIRDYLFPPTSNELNSM